MVVTSRLFFSNFKQHRRLKLSIIIAIISPVLQAFDAPDDIVSGFDVGFDTAPVLVVTAPRHRKDNILNNEFVSVEDIASSPASIAEMLSFEQGLSANGQSGLFQTISIRGVARQRVHAYINGMRITSERRAGVAASFVDPLLLAGVEVTQGPASTYYGSGAIGSSRNLLVKIELGAWKTILPPK